MMIRVLTNYGYCIRAWYDILSYFYFLIYTKECMGYGRISSINIKLWQDRRVCYL